MSQQIEEIIHACELLELHAQQIHQPDLSSFYAQIKGGGLYDNSMNLNYGGEGNTHLWEI